MLSAKTFELNNIFLHCVDKKILVIEENVQGNNDLKKMCNFEISMKILEIRWLFFQANFKGTYIGSFKITEKYHMCE